MTLQAPTLQTSRALDAAIAVARFGLGARPGELAQAGADPRGWLKSQIARDGADQPQGSLASSRDGFVTYRTAVSEARTFQRELAGAAPTPMTDTGGAADATAERIKAERRLLLKPIRDGVVAEIQARAQLGATTRSPFRERWALFWANHFTVSAAKPQAAALAGPFEREAIRPHVFGRFEDLLVSSSTHPGMLAYLDQARSAGPDSVAGQRHEMGLNENLAREIMELHTVGPDAGYAQADVTEFARAPTGYSIGTDRDGAERAGAELFRPNLHEPGARKIMGRTYPEGGAEQARAVLRDLAANPRTADQIARRLAIHFVADAPPPALVARLREAYLRSGGDLAIVAAALIDAPEAWSPTAGKFKQPYEFLVSSYRAVGVVPADPFPDVIQPLTQFGQRPFAAPQPNGWSDQASDWIAPDALVKRMTWASNFALAHAPQTTAPADLASAVLGDRLTPPTRLAIARAETRPEALALLLMSPEFQRR